MLKLECLLQFMAYVCLAASQLLAVCKRACKCTCLQAHLFFFFEFAIRGSHWKHVVFRLSRRVLRKKNGVIGLRGVDVKPHGLRRKSAFDPKTYGFQCHEHVRTVAVGRSYEAQM
ncbi:hypothetical protein C8R47DRAFT_1086404, partial [Mycena vitilis]